jgi:uncharacterized protein YdhG (YjbR/CyaY superfamily)
MKMLQTKTVDGYIKMFPKDIAERLTAIRKIIQKLAPRAEEGISYGMPSYKLNGPLVYFAGFKNHIGLYALPKTGVVFQKELSSYKTSKGTVQFQHTEPLPLPLIRKIVTYRVKENKAKKPKK